METDTIPVVHIKLASEYESKPSFFEIIFSHNKHIFRYGFEINKKKVVSEWLYYVPIKKEVELFFSKE